MESKRFASFLAKDYFIQGRDIKRGSEIGRGAYGIVYEGVYRETLYAFKYIHHHMIQTASTRKFSIEKFEKECEMTRALSSPNVVNFVGVSYDDHVPVLITELLECSLTDVLGCRHCSLTYHREIDIALGIAKGLDCLHRHGVVHRDLSSNNILLGRDYTAKIADLGVAKCIEEFCGTPMPGTPYYMPPEVHVHTSLSVALDMYSYAVLLMQLETRAELKPLDKLVKVSDDHDSEGEIGVKSDKKKVDGENKEEAEPQVKGREPVPRSKPHYVKRSEYERWVNLVCLMNQDGVLHRIVKCYLEEDPEDREATPLTQVMGWLDEETCSAEYIESLTPDLQQEQLEHRSSGHSSRSNRNPSSSSSITPLAGPRKKGRGNTSDSGFYSEATESTSSPWQVVESENQVPSPISRRGVMERLQYSMMRMSTVMGLTSVGEDDDEYRERVLGSL